MKQIVENQVRSNIGLLSYSYHQKNDDSIEVALREGSIRLLVEQNSFDESDVSQKIDSTRKAIASVADALPESASELKRHLAELGNEIPSGAGVAGAIVADDEKELQKLSQKVATSTDKAMEFAATVQSAFSRIGSQFKKFEVNLNKSERTRPIRALAEEAEVKPDTWKEKFITLDQLRSGLEKSFIPPPWYKKTLQKAQKWMSDEGVSGKVGKWLSNLFNSDEGISSEAFISAVLEMSFDEFMKTSDKMQNLEENLSQATADSAEAAAVATTVASGQDPPDTGDTGESATGEDSALSSSEIEATDSEAEQLVAALGKIPVPKKKLTALLKKPEFSDIGGKGGKATRARRKLRLAINDLAGKEVFEEGLLTGARRAKMTNTDDDEAFDRWKELAGIKS